MKKLKKFLIVLFGLFPLICSADVEKEVRYRWYTLIEDNVRYESSVEDICEYYDKDKVIYSDWIFSLDKPLEKDNRVIKEKIEEIHIRRDNFNIIRLTSFENGYEDFPILEMNFYDKNNNLLANKLTNYFAGGDISHLTDNNLNTSVMVNPSSSFTYYFDDLIDIRDFKIIVKYREEEATNNFRTIGFSIALDEYIFINNFSYDNEIVDTVCEDGVCVKEISIKEEFFNDDIIFKGKGYIYQDKLFKCYDLKKLYVPGYYNDLEGFIKDDNDFIEIVKEVKVETIPSNDLSDDNYESDNSVDDFINNNEIVNVEEKIEDFSLDKPLAMVIEDNKKSKSVFPYVIMIIVLFIFSILAFVIKKVIISRTK